MREFRQTSKTSGGASKSDAEKLADYALAIVIGIGLAMALVSWWAS